MLNKLIFGIAVIVVLAVSVYVYESPGSAKTPTYWAAAKRTAITEKCLAADNSIAITSGERSNIELSAISYLIDVPAGTNVDVNLASYSDTKITGSDRYPDTYGSYNFTLDKRGNDWIVTRFKHCD